MTHLPVLAVLFSSATLFAQVFPGDIGVTGFSTSNFGVVTGSGVTSYSTPGFGGTSTSQAILWDPSNPQDFLIGGFGFVGRATITGPGTVSYTVLTTGIGTASQMSFDFAGNVVIADAGTNQIRVLDLATNTVTDLTTGPQPWGTTLNAGAFNPTNGDIIIGNNNNLFRLPFGTSTPVPFAQSLGGYLSGVTFDVNGDVICTVLQQNRLIRIDALGVITDIIPPSTISGPNAVAQDINLDWIVGGSGGRVSRVPYTGGSATLIGTNTSPSTNVSGLSVVGGGSGGSATSFGTGCSGQFGQVSLSISGNIGTGQTITHVSNNHASGQLGVALFGLSNTTYASNALPYSLDTLLGTSGCSLYIAIDATQIGFSGNGSPAQLSFTIDIPALPTGASFFIQHACFEPVPGSTSWSNGIYLQLP